ncbi:family 20 glycosylhydrolase [Niastella populi]|uniref:beta-N-acetylhexosaminidase n=1 Tax=Niastella populi TaxID=550983 RepID=A0A1V9F7Q3_9BACT|nr:family 20 glycosylhydrolase [Niastella populi]OQP54443.1 beta-hexosaminidase [Niastella populi]
MRYISRLVLTGMVLLLFVHVRSQTAAPALIPYPASVTPAKGEFIITPGTGIVYDTKDGFDLSLAELSRLIPSGKSLPRPSAKVIELQKDAAITSPEGYQVNITEQKVLLKAGTPAGMFRAVQTIRQLMPLSIEKNPATFQSMKLPALTIIDEPTYAWRGIHLDVSRHFFAISYLEKLIDAMALYKLNKLHLHLTDDQGWRIEIKKYPQLTEQGAWRTFDKNDSFCIRQQKDNPDMAIEPKHIIQRNGKTLYGGFYTQQQMKDLVKFAAARYIDIIPEVDMPGHMMAAIHAFPDLSCEGGSKWGELFSTPICPCKESTFEFAQNVFTEIMEIFPSEYIHLGADEVDRRSWEKSELCKELMQKEGLKNSAELQSYFVKRMEQFFHSKGRKLIGWDEILEGGISATANVMYWRSWVPDAPVTAARNGNNVIMSPGNPLYFDNLPDAHSLSNIYHFNVVPEKLSAKDAKFIIGAQANLWTERVPSENRADYLYFPRMLSLAERVWSKELDFAAFQQRLPAHYNRLEAMRIHYRLPDLGGFAENNVFTDQAVLDIKKPMPNLVLRYTTNGTLPTVTSPVLGKPLTIKQPVTIKLAAFTANGLRGDIYTLNYKKEKYLEPVTVGKTTNGLQAKLYKKYLLNTKGMKPLQPDSQFVAANAAVPAGVGAPSFGLQYSGYIDIPETGIYSFYLLVDDGGVLTIGDKEVVDNDGQHAPLEKSGQIALKKGLHPFRLNFIEGGGGFTLQLKYSKSGGSPMSIPDSFFKH